MNSYEIEITIKPKNKILLTVYKNGYCINEMLLNEKDNSVKRIIATFKMISGFGIVELNVMKYE